MTATWNQSFDIPGVRHGVTLTPQGICMGAERELRDDETMGDGLRAKITVPWEHAVARILGKPGFAGRYPRVLARIRRGTHVDGLGFAQRDGWVQVDVISDPLDYVLANSLRRDEWVPCMPVTIRDGEPRRPGLTYEIPMGKIARFRVDDPKMIPTALAEDIESDGALFGLGMPEGIDVDDLPDADPLRGKRLLGYMLAGTRLPGHGIVTRDGWYELNTTLHGLVTAGDHDKIDAFASVRDRRTVHCIPKHLFTTFSMDEGERLLINDVPLAKALD